MAQLTTPQRVFVVNKYQSTKSYVEVKRLFAVEYPDKVYVTPPASIADLKGRITREFDLLKRNHQLIRSAMWAMLNRVEVCIDRNGGHVEGNFR